MKNKTYELVRDLFVFSIFTSLSYADVKNLTTDNLQTFFDGNLWIITRRENFRKWIEATDAIGMISKAGRNGGTYAHKDIAFEFGSWLNPVFKLYLITSEIQKLRERFIFQSVKSNR